MTYRRQVGTAFRGKNALVNKNTGTMMSCATKPNLSFLDLSAVEQVTSGANTVMVVNAV